MTDSDSGLSWADIAAVCSHHDSGGLTLKSISSQQVQTEHQNIRLPNAIDRSMLDTAVPALSGAGTAAIGLERVTVLIQGHCLDSRTTTTPVGSGSCGLRLVRLSSFQLARLTISPA